MVRTNVIIDVLLLRGHTKPHRDDSQSVFQSFVAYKDPNNGSCVALAYAPEADNSNEFQPIREPKLVINISYVH